MKNKIASAWIWWILIAVLLLVLIIGSYLLLTGKKYDPKTHWFSSDESIPDSTPKNSNGFWNNDNNLPSSNIPAPPAVPSVP